MILFEKSVGLEQLEIVAQHIVKSLNDTPILLFYGELGAGKTTLIKNVCKLIGVKENMSSPSFGIINEYRTFKDVPVYHMDLYRLKNLQDFQEIGGEEYLYSNNICLIEWPQIIDIFIEINHLRLEIAYQHDIRNYKLSLIES